MNSPKPKAQSPKPEAQSPKPVAKARLALRQSRGSGLWALGFGLVLAACYPTTTRPAFLPEPTAPVAEVELAIPEATRAAGRRARRRLHSGAAHRAEGRLAGKRLVRRDDAAADPRRRLGPDVVKVRVWVDPSRPNHSNITVETVYRPFADPSRPDRELEQQVPANHRVGSEDRSDARQIEPAIRRGAA